MTPARYSYTHTQTHTHCNRYLELLYLIDTFGSEGQLQLTPFARALLLAQLKVTPRKSRNGKGKRMNVNEENYYRCSVQFSSSFCAIFPHLTNAIIICYNFRQAKVGPDLTWPGLVETCVGNVLRYFWYSLIMREDSLHSYCSRDCK